MLTVGQYATDIHTGKTIQIVGAQQVFGVTTYRCYEPDTGKIYSTSEKALNADSALSRPSEALVRFAAAFSRVRNELASGIVFDVSESVIPLPHQRYALERAMATNEVRYMLADEVGLGKTIGGGPHHQGIRNARPDRARSCGMPQRPHDPMGGRNAGENSASASPLSSPRNMPPSKRLLPIRTHFPAYPT